MAVDAYEWLFGDSGKSTEEEPVHTYVKPGWYDVTLRYREDGVWGEITKRKYIHVFPLDAVVSRTNRCFTLALLPEQGIGFSENTGDYPFPESGDNSLLVYDDDDQPHLLVLDNNDGYFYDIMQRDGPEGSGIVKLWKDKVAADGSGGSDYAPLVAFGADVGTFEHFWLKHLLSYIFARAADAKYRGASGYDAAGFPDGLALALRLYVDGERVTADRIVEDIPITGSIHTDESVQGHRLQLEIEGNMGAHTIVGRKQEYMVTDKYIGDGIMTEDDYQEEFASPVTWFSRELHDIDRATGGAMAAEQYAKCETCEGPDEESDSGLSFTEAIVFPTSITLASGTIMLWHQSLSSVAIGSTPITLTEYGRIGDWILSYKTGVTASGVVTITPSGTGKIFDGPRAYNYAISTGAIGYYYDNISEHGGDVVLP